MKESNLMKIDVIYCNGCSHSAGGGMELNRFIDDKSITVREYYKNKYNVYLYKCLMIVNKLSRQSMD